MSASSLALGRHFHAFRGKTCYLRKRATEFSEIWRRNLSELTNLSLNAGLVQPLKRLSWRLLVMAALAVLATPGRAQSTASISGTVHDATGALVPGAKIVLIQEASKASWNTTSNDEGFFNFSALQPATYSLDVSRQGFETRKVTGIVVHPGDSLTLSKIELNVGRAEVSVTVNAESAGVMLNSPEHGTIITSTEINRLSTIGRDASELIAILPGFTINAGTNMQNEGPGGLYGFQVVGPGSAQIGSWGAGGAAPQQGLVNLKSDGANLIDPGDMGGTISTVNMDQVQEVKVQTSNFGADQSKGPIVIDAVGKTGSAQFHGSLYTYFRNSALNSNDWLSKYYGAARPEFRFFYPGATIGGPVIIPHTRFKTKSKLFFWAGFEVYRQMAPEALAQSFIPTPAMLNGDFSQGTIAKALNVPVDGANGLTINCPKDYQVSASFSNVGGDCYSPDGATDVMGNTVSGGQLPYIDPATTAISSLWPKANRTPQPVFSGGTLLYQSDGTNYVKNVTSTHNGFQFHDTEDYSITGTLKLHAAYNWERVNDESQMNNIYYTPGGTVPFPTPLYWHGHNQSLTLDLTKTVGSSLTNQVVASGIFFFQPAQFGDPAKAQSTGTPWAAAGYTQGHLGLDESQLPRIIEYDPGIPSFAFGYVPSGSKYPNSQFLRKFSWNIGDNLTKVYKTHTIKVGYYMEQTGNSGVTLGSQVNGTLTFMRWDTCWPNQIPATPPDTDQKPANEASLGNTTANFLTGCPLGYNQDNGDPVQNVRYRSFEWYGTDEWKVLPKLTLTLGIRFAHMQPWNDAHGVGIAVWNPTGVPQHVLNPNGVVTASNTTWPGIYWHKRNPQYPNSGFPTKALFYEPRGGFAYDLSGNGKTVIRGGWGMYISHDSTGATGGLSTAIGLETYSNPSTTTCTFGQLFTNKYLPCGTWSGTPSSTITPFTVSAADPKDSDMPVTYNYNLTIDRQGPWKSVFEIAYVGNRSQHLMTLGNLQNQNVIPLGAEFAPDPVTNQLYSVSNIPNTADYRPYPNYQQVNVARHILWSNYNSLQAQWNRQSGAFVYGANYTWSKAMGVRGNWDTGAISDPVNPRHDYGIVSFDRPQAFNLTYSYQEGTKFHGNHILGQALNGWEASGIVSYQSGPDLAVLNGSTSFGLSGGVNYSAGSTSVSQGIGGQQWLGSGDYTLQPVVTCDPSSGLKKNFFVNGKCFALPALGMQGWWNLPDVHGPAYFKSDLSIYKDFKINERQSIQLRGSGFNFLNHPLTSFSNNNLSTMSLQAGDCSATDQAANTCPQYTSLSQALENTSITNASNFGSTSYKDGVRIVELAFKYTF